MAVYAIGDVHGCLPQLLTLLEAVGFRPGRDRLLFVGDIISRGPDSLGTIRFVRDQGERAVALMGNHELRAINALLGFPEKGFSKHLGFLTTCPERDEILAWMRQRPFVHHEPELKLRLVHAGFWSGWSLDQAMEYARRLSAILHDEPTLRGFLARSPANLPDSESPSMDETARLHFAMAIMTRLRICQPDGRVVWAIPGATGGAAFKLEPDSPYLPWHALLDWPVEERIVYGHWAIAGLSRNGRFIGLDSGCVYGGKLTAMRVDHPDLPITQVPCPAYVKPE
ncbi:MAG: symmetrical bis(5'-nucleosyl)-tetraphosphatase [Magnetococcales bacterium]|nr:symmetrical bis(5'-nucleosyl)-tetraphosphatase [Magnetococcales bacterium]